MRAAKAVRTAALALVGLALAGELAAAEARRLVIDLSHDERVTYRGQGSGVEAEPSKPVQDVDRWADGLAAASDFEVEVARSSPFSLRALDGVSVVAVLQPDGSALSSSEARALRTWIERGGVLVVAADSFLTSSAGTFATENFRRQRRFASHAIANSLLAGLGLATRFHEDAICSPTQRPSGTGESTLDDVFQEQTPDSVVAMPVAGSVGSSRSTIAISAGSSLTGAQAQLAVSPDGSDFYTVDREEAGQEFQDPSSGRTSSKGCEHAAHRREGGGIAGITLDELGGGSVVASGDLGFHAASYGSGAWYDNESYGIKPFWNALLPAIAGPGVRTLDDAGEPADSAPAGTTLRSAPREESGPQRRPPLGSERGGRGGQGGGRSDRGEGDGGGGGEGAAGSGGGGVTRGVAGTDAGALGRALPGRESSGGRRAGGGREARRLTSPGGDPLFDERAGGSAALARPDAPPDGEGEGPPGWLVSLVAGAALASLAGGFGLERRRVRRIAF